MKTERKKLSPRHVAFFSLFSFLASLSNSLRIVALSERAFAVLFFSFFCFSPASESFPKHRNSTVSASFLRPFLLLLGWTRQAVLPLLTRIVSPFSLGRRTRRTAGTFYPRRQDGAFIELNRDLRKYTIKVYTFFSQYTCTFFFF